MSLESPSHREAWSSLLLLFLNRILRLEDHRVSRPGEGRVSTTRRGDAVEPGEVRVTRTRRGEERVKRTRGGEGN